MSLQIPAELPPDHDRGPLIHITTWTITSLAIVFVVLRLYTRLFVRTTAGLDDLLMGLAVSIQLVNTCDEKLR